MNIMDVIDMRKDLFSKIECATYDILVPFVCMKTGGCCSVYMPFIPETDLLQIALDLHEDECRLYDACRSRFRINISTHPKPCIFLDHNNLCRIHEHPLRPAVCRLYPFSYGGAAEKCPSYREHKRFITLLTPPGPACELYDASFCPNREVRPIPDREWSRILEIFQRGGPFPEMKEKFILWNHHT